MNVAAEDITLTTDEHDCANGYWICLCKPVFGSGIRCRVSPLTVLTFVRELTTVAMPIKHLESVYFPLVCNLVLTLSPSAYLQERKHLQTLPLNVLTDSRLGIDAAYYLQSLYDNPSTREPLLAATGGLSLALTTRIESDLRTLEKLRIKPVFVFPGLNPNKRWRHMQRDIEQQEACRERNLAWSKYESGQEEAATKLFEGRSGLTHWDLWRPVLRIFRNRNVEFLVAPYVAWAQVCWLSILS